MRMLKNTAYHSPELSETDLDNGERCKIVIYWRSNEFSRTQLYDDFHFYKEQSLPKNVLSWACKRENQSDSNRSMSFDKLIVILKELTEERR
ncbi:1734_t:CDS:2 [Funneliformis geosporum]|nr:1734_t:CDS:2 [Funneliformis geosporum]